MQIKDIILEDHLCGDELNIAARYLDISWKDIEGNSFDDGKNFCAVSFDGEWCCIGSIKRDDYEDSENPNIRIRLIFKRV